MALVTIQSTIPFTPEEKKKFFELCDAAISKVHKSKVMTLVEIPPENQYGNATGGIYFIFFAPYYPTEDQKRGLIKDLDSVVKEIFGSRIPTARACVIIKHHHGCDAGFDGIMHLDRGIY